MRKFAIPVALFAALAALLGFALLKMQSGEYSPHNIPSPLIGKPVPPFSLPSLTEPTKTVTNETLRGRAYLLNVWASWCVACREEHPLLVAARRERHLPIIGLNYKDQREDALRWLEQLGNPYEMSIADVPGRFGIDLGVYGVPETFLIDRDGVIRYKHIGPITPEALDKVLLPKLAELSAPQ
ncbi:MAG: DsbE family thiol:disulfide interchange protein [Sulfurifustaceae bacterium]